MNSWKRFCQAFEDVEVALQGLRQSGEDSLVAKVTTSFTITKRIMCSVFPHLKSSTSDGNTSQIVEKLLGQRVTTRGTTWFQWDSALGCITGLMSETDMISPMLGLLGSLEDVSLVFEKLPVSLEAA
ncbi:uncharacterized protein IUM83_08075 [Phytophthora cinnamomi]|uniref:uncharacterized protein n=1 Tax=Phytophthora cinnamomi TaxID=4785 RepID=UPI00355A1438|nr:hypothetical protein IUM83_08075 [Phytophthora cinnamomi]